MVIESRTVVSLKYRLTINDEGAETEVEQTSASRPFVFLFGYKNVLPAFEKNLEGKKAGDPFDFELTVAEAYGTSDEKNIVPIAMSAFHGTDGKPDQELLVIGKTLTMNDGQGRTFHGIVKEISDETVTMDFNHPLADKQLHFIGEVLDVRLATLEELQHGHVHGPGGHHH